MFCKKDVLKNFEKFAGKHLCRSLFIKKRVQHRCFPYVLRVPSCSTCLTCLLALRTYMLYVFTFLTGLRTFVPLLLTYLRFYMCLTCAHVLGAFIFLRALILLRALCASIFLRAFLFCVLYVSSFFYMPSFFYVPYVFSFSLNAPYEPSFFTYLQFFRCLHFIYMLSFFLYAFIFFMCLHLFT